MMVWPHSQNLKLQPFYKVITLLGVVLHNTEKLADSSLMHLLNL